MFEKTFSFWRRLLGKAEQPAAEAGTATQDERRLWARYPAEVEACARVATRNGPRLRVQVRDLSIGGALLLIDRPVELGQLLSLELPGAEDVLNVLACVVRVNEEGEDLYSVGCVFAHELTEDDLARFGASRVQAEDHDQRTWVRFHCALSAHYREVGDITASPQPAQILNISATGIGLSVQPTLQAGALLNVDLIDKTGRVVRSMLACVVHTTRRSAGDMAIGCNFIRELSEDELHAIL